MNKRGNETLFAVTAIGFLLFGFWLVYSGLNTVNSDRVFSGILSIGLAAAVGKYFIK